MRREGILNRKRGSQEPRKTRALSSVLHYPALLTVINSDQLGQHLSFTILRKATSCQQRALEGSAVPAPPGSCSQQHPAASCSATSGSGQSRLPLVRHFLWNDHLANDLLGTLSGDLLGDPGSPCRQSQVGVPMEEAAQHLLSRLVSLHRAFSSGPDFRPEQRLEESPWGVLFLPWG